MRLIFTVTIEGENAATAFETKAEAMDYVVAHTKGNLDFGNSQSPFMGSTVWAITPSGNRTTAAIITAVNGNALKEG